MSEHSSALSAAPAPTSAGASDALSLTSPWPVAGLFTSTLFLSSALVFFVQPMFAKMALPLLGGSPNVWNVCVVFFQAALLAGYGYAHLLTTRLGGRAQVVVHLTLMVAAVLTLPIAIDASWAQASQNAPTLWLLAMLTASVGAPFFVVSSSAPLLQRWFSHTRHEAAADPYFLYAASNVGSLLALVAYPFVVEPGWALPSQSRAWSWSFALLGVLVAACGATSVARRPAAASPRHHDVAATSADAPTWAARGRWVALSAIPSSLMLSVTTYLSTDIAAVPLLWIAPLSLYLLSFVLGFARRGQALTAFASRRVPPLLYALVVVLGLQMTGQPRLLVPLHLTAFFALATALSGQLARERPAAAHLTQYYCWMAWGGVVGGLFNTLVAPRLFTSIAEYPLVLVAAAAFVPLGTAGSWRVSRTDVVAAVAAAIATVVMVLALKAKVDRAVFAVVVGLLVTSYAACARSGPRFAMGVGLSLAAAFAVPHGRAETLHAERTFFGTYHVNASDGFHRLSHGTTVHGLQSLDPTRRNEPLSYYGRQGIGMVLGSLDQRGGTASIGAVGLGAGTLAAYARPGQSWTFFEIDPAVERIARDRRLFTYLDRCGQACRVVLGDARLSLQQDAGTYDVLVLDAFSSDAIPVHLITREAVALYLSRLRPGGLLAFHISNRHLQLRPQLAAIARDLGLVSSVRHRVVDDNSGEFTSEWVAMARATEGLPPPIDGPPWLPVQAAKGTRTWTDDFSNILDVMRWK